MANIVRSAKSGSDWTSNDLDAYHITIQQVDHLLFFGLQVSRGSSAFVIGKTQQSLQSQHNLWSIKSCSPFLMLTICNKTVTQSWSGCLISPIRVKLPLILPSNCSRSWVMFIGNDWRAREWTSPSHLR